VKESFGAEMAVKERYLGEQNLAGGVQAILLAHWGGETGVFIISGRRIKAFSCAN